MGHWDALNLIRLDTTRPPVDMKTLPSHRLDTRPTLTTLGRIGTTLTPKGVGILPSRKVCVDAHFATLTPKGVRMLPSLPPWAASPPRSLPMA
jgi:hypothetical protein